MSRKNSHITITDQFCGAGGSSQGARRLSRRNGGGIEIKMALNHWKLAIDTHQTNFPDTDHDCTDISACDPRRYPSTDILITSPECTTHSPAGGNNHKTLKKQMDMFQSGVIDPATERSRATMWDVCRFAEYHKYNAIIVENVVEAKTRWQLFDVWLTAMHTLGYNHKCVYLNSMHCHPTPQSRDRMYIVFWKKGNKAPMLDYTPAAYCHKCNGNVQSIQTWKDGSKPFGKFRTQYVYCCPTCTNIVEPYYYASMNIIDWTNIGKRIGDKPLKEYRDRKSGQLLSFNGKTQLPLAPNTLVRVAHGKKKYWTDGGYLLDPFVVNDQHTTGVDFRVKPSGDKLPTLTTTHKLKLISPPFIVKLEHSKTANIHSTTEFLSTQTTTQGQAVVLPPFLIEMSSNGHSRGINDPLSTITAGGYKNGIVTPPDGNGIVTSSSWNSFISAYNNGSHIVKHYTQELPTQATKQRNALVVYENKKDIAIEDCYYRMLTEVEVKLGMAFDHTYKILGSKKDQVKQCGNAVTPPAMEWLIQQVVESLN